jgi:hypothetical protein
MSGALDIAGFVRETCVGEYGSQALPDARRFGVGGADETVDADVVTFEQLRKAIERFGAIRLDEPVPALKRLEEGHLDLVELRTSAADAARPVDESNAAQACRRPLRDGNNRRRGHLVEGPRTLVAYQPAAPMASLSPTISRTASTASGTAIPKRVFRPRQ